MLRHKKWVSKRTLDLEIKYDWGALLDCRFGNIQRRAQRLPYLKSKSLTWMSLSILFWIFQVNCAASETGFIWMPAGSRKFKFAVCISVLCWSMSGYVNWLSAGGLCHFQIGINTLSAFLSIGFLLRVSQVFLSPPQKWICLEIVSSKLEGTAHH